MGIGQYKTLPISYVDAAELILNINLNKDKLIDHPVLVGNAGGTFRAKDVEEWVFQDGFVGLMCWYCLNDNKDFFIAIEPCYKGIFEYDETDIKNKKPIQDTLLIPKRLIKENLYEDEGLAGTLSRYKNGVSGKQKTATKDQVCKWVDNYMKATNCTIGISPFSFFIGEDDKGKNYLKDFLNNKKPKNIRYFFSYAPDEEHKAFPLRVILAPVNLFGRNINNSSGKAVVGDDVLQYSWPPKH